MTKLNANPNLLIGAIALLGCGQFFRIMDVGIMHPRRIWILTLESIDNRGHSVIMKIGYDIYTGESLTKAHELFDIKDVYTVNEFLSGGVKEEKKPVPASFQFCDFDKIEVKFVLHVRRVCSPQADPENVKNYKKLLKEVFGLDCNKFDFIKLYNRDTGSTVEVTCTKSQFADFVIKRNELGLANDIAPLNIRVVKS